MIDKLQALVKRIQSGTAWEDAKFGARHFNNIERLAIVWQNMGKRIGLFLQVFPLAKVCYFDIDDRDEARAWVRETE